MPGQFIWLLIGATSIVLLGRWSKQNRVTVVALCCLWGGLVSSLR